MKKIYLSIFCILGSGLSCFIPWFALGIVSSLVFFSLSFVFLSMAMEADSKPAKRCVAK